MQRVSLPASLFIIGIISGLLYRLFPIFSGPSALTETFMTEDGYLMLTVARNMAIGLGMSVSDGMIATNGVQPLATFLFTIPYILTDGDKVSSLIGIHLIAAGAAVGGLFAVRAFAARVLYPQTDDPFWSWAAAGLWFLGPLLLLHTMNGLETGLYTFVLLMTLLSFANILEKGIDASPLACLALGAWTGLAFLARNDAVFLVTAIFAVWALYDLTCLRINITRMLARVMPAGLVSLLIAAPWLINNQLRFGSIVPISGSAQSIDTPFGANADLLPAKFFEYLFPMLPVPSGWETKPIAIWVFGAISIAIMAVFVFQTMRRGGPVLRAIVIAYLVHALCLSLYYGLTFGAPHFMSRYMAPLAPLLIVASLSVAMDFGRWIFPSRPRFLAATYAIGGLLLTLALLGRLLMPGVKEQGHMQVVGWVEQNVPEETWVGAIQTGTLGYWHDRTINLDGKVNPKALAERREHGHVLHYIVDSDIDYIADWAGVGYWVDRNEGGFSDAFELILQDHDIDLSIIRRRTADQS